MPVIGPSRQHFESMSHPGSQVTYTDDPQLSYVWPPHSYPYSEQ